jgi:Family of unknown function (DUF6157)
MSPSPLHSTNYTSTFITVAPDRVAQRGVAPPLRASASVAERMFVLISKHPYQFTSDDVIFTVWADRQGIDAKTRPRAREQFFSKGQPSLRSSDLAKKYGWGIHHDAEGRVALVGVEAPAYRRLASEKAGVTVKAAMRSARNAAHEKGDATR